MIQYILRHWAFGRHWLRVIGPSAVIGAARVMGRVAVIGAARVSPGVKFAPGKFYPGLGLGDRPFRAPGVNRVGRQLAIRVHSRKFVAKKIEQSFCQPF